MPIFLSPDTRTRNFEQTIRKIIPADFDGDPSVASHRIAFLAEVQGRGFRDTSMKTMIGSAWMEESLGLDMAVDIE